MTLDQEVVNSTILITGSSSGIGYALSKKVLQEGANSIVITGRDSGPLKSAAVECQQGINSDISSHDVKVLALKYDQKCKDSIDELCSAMLENDRMPLTVFANVGVNLAHEIGFHKTHSTDYQIMQETLTTNVSNTFYLIKKILPTMRKERFGRIVLIGSQSYQYGVAGQVSYNVSKSALSGLKNTINREYSKANIKCYLYNLGVIDNKRVAKYREKNISNESLNILSETDVTNEIWRSFISDPEQHERNIP